MRRIISLSIIPLFFFGCVGTQIEAPANSINKIAKIAVVPIEPPPLEVSPFAPVDSFLGTSAFTATVPVDSLRAAGAAGVFVSTIFLMVKLPEGVKDSAKTIDSIESMLASGKVWIPTVVFAQEVAKQISSLNKYDIITTQNIQKFPGFNDRERTFFLRNWYSQIENWYNEKKSIFEYKSLKEQGVDAVLEVGMHHWVLGYNHITLQILLRLIDPMTGQVLGRAGKDLLQRERTDGILEHDAKRFKELYTYWGAVLITTNLKSIGIIPD